LATGPSVIFADEPTGNLDKKSSLGIVKLLQQINSLGTTVLIATHDVTLLDVLDSERHLELEGGKLVRDTKPSQPPAVEQAVEPSESEDKSEPEGKSKPEPEPEPELNPKKQPKKTKADKKAAKKAATKKEAKEKTEEKPLSAEFAEVTNEAQTEKRSILGSIGKKLPSLKLPFFGKNKTPPKASKPVDQPTQPEEHEEHHE
jgi:ABC-type multidrug transport system ATPase subunit